MTSQQWYLRDADKIQKENPYTFYKPSKEILDQLKPGDFARLIFEFDPQADDGCSAERMWVKIEERNCNGFQGALDNKPVYIKSLALGDIVAFKEQHIVDTNQKDLADAALAPFAKLCIATKSILEGDKVGLLQRFDPNNEKDSGWCFSGINDTQHYLDNKENIQVVSIGVVLNRDDSFLNLLKSPAGTAYELNESTGEFVRSEFDKLE